MSGWVDEDAENMGMGSHDQAPQTARQGTGMRARWAMCFGGGKRGTTRNRHNEDQRENRAETRLVVVRDVPSAPENVQEKAKREKERRGEGERGTDEDQTRWTGHILRRRRTNMQAQATRWT